MTNFLKTLYKALVSVVAVAAGAVSLGLLPHPWDVVVAAVVAVLGAFGVYVAPYTPLKASTPATVANVPAK